MVCMNSLSMLSMMNNYCDIDQNRKNGPNVVEFSLDSDDKNSFFSFSFFKCLHYAKKPN